MKTSAVIDDPTTTSRTHIDRGDARVAGWAALGAGVTTVALIALYFVYSGPPPASNVLTRSLLTLIMLALLSVFGVAFGRLLPVDGHGRRSLPGQLALVSLFTYVAVILFATSLEAGTPLWQPHASLDPTTDGPLAAAMALAHGPIAHLWIAMFLAGFASAVSASGLSRLVPRWAVRGCVSVAVINVLAIPSMYFGMDATDFYAVNGWGADALVGLITMVWVGLVGLGILRSGPARSLTAG